MFFEKSGVLFFSIAKKTGQDMIVILTASSKFRSEKRSLAATTLLVRGKDQVSPVEEGMRGATLTAMIRRWRTEG